MMLKNKEELVKNIFTAISSRYDLMNDVMSFGIHRLWKNIFINKISEYNIKLLDVAGGTGDISFKYYLKSLNYEESPEITILDLNLDMLKKAQDNLIARNLLNKFSLVAGNALELPFPDNYFDCYTISYGLRNVSDISCALAEAKRVLKRGGKFLCLEFSHINNQLFQKLYDLYSFNFIPFLGKTITGSKESYEYLVESIRMFPEQRKLCQLIEKAGFKAVSYENLTMGLSAIHWGYKL